jgi:hypothetical protein
LAAVWLLGASSAEKCNTALGKLADNALIEAFGPWLTLRDIRREGANPAKTVETKKGNRVRLEAEGSKASTRTICATGTSLFPRVMVSDMNISFFCYCCSSNTRYCGREQSTRFVQSIFS